MLPKYLREGKSAHPTANYAHINRFLESQIHQVVELWNDRAESPHWQSRYFLIHSGEAIFLDVIDAAVSTRPVKVVVHNRLWDEQASESALTYIFSLLSNADAQFFITKGPKHGGK
jgi:hypothetical protein